jgi:type I restriction enzyme, S subunit
MAGEAFIDCTVGEIAAQTRNALVGGPFGSDLVSKDYVPTGVPVIRGTNMGHGRWVDGEFAYVTSEKAESLSSNCAKPGDIVFTQRGTLGQVALVPKKGADRYLISQSQMKLTVDAEKADAMFLYYVFTSAEQQNYIRQNAIQTGVPHTNLGILRNTPLTLPPLAKQKAIAAVLGALDDKIELNRRMSATLEAMARALFQSWFVDFDPVRAKLDGRQPAGLEQATATLFPDSFQDSELGPIPAGWTVATIDEATSLIIDYRGRTPKKMGSEWSTTGIPAVSAKNVKGGRLVRPDTFNFVSEELYDRWMKDKLALGDILMTSEAPLGELYYLALDARYCLSQRIFALRANASVCEPAFLYYWLESPACQREIINRGTGTTVEGIRQSELRRVSVLLPPLSTQKAAAKFLSTWTEQIHRNEEQSGTLASLRDSLLPKLLSGELSVS